MDEQSQDMRVGPLLVVEANPETVGPRSELVLTARLETDEPIQVEGEIVFYDATGAEAGRASLSDLPGHTQQQARIECIAPDSPGAQTWTARLESADCSCEDAAFTVTVAPHPISVSVWDVPSAIEQGTSFPMMVGLKCPCGCDAKGWSFRLLDDQEQEITTGTVGDEPWPGTTSLYYARLDLGAPDAEGAREWAVIAVPPEGDTPHAQRRLPVRLNVSRSPEVTLRIEAVDAVTNAPVPRAKVVAHPYRCRTNEDGVAELRLPRGFYTVFVSGSPYFAFKSSGEITEDMALKAVMYEDREFSLSETWA